MREVEVKILEVNRSSLEKVLLKRGAKKYFEGELETIIYIAPGVGLRLRREGTKVILTYKKIKKTGVKTAEETSVAVTSMDEGKAFLAALGYKVRGTTMKRRVGYVLGEVKFDFDSYTKPTIPELLEIEAPSTKVIYENAVLLGFSRKQCLPWTAGDLFNHYKVKL